MIFAHRPQFKSASVSGPGSTKNSVPFSTAFTKEVGRTLI